MTPSSPREELSTCAYSCLLCSLSAWLLLLGFTAPPALRLLGGCSVQTMPPTDTTKALQPRQKVRHCHGAASLQNTTPLAMETVAPRTAVTTPTPRAPSSCLNSIAWEYELKLNSPKGRSQSSEMLPCQTSQFAAAMASCCLLPHAQCFGAGLGRCVARLCM